MRYAAHQRVRTQPFRVGGLYHGGQQNTVVGERSRHGVPAVALPIAVAHGGMGTYPCPRYRPTGLSKLEMAQRHYPRTASKPHINAIRTFYMVHGSDHLALAQTTMR